MQTASCYHLAENDLLEAGFAASAQYCREGTAGGKAGVSKVRWTVALQPSEKWTYEEEVLCRSAVEYQEFMLAEILPVKLPCSNKASNRSIQKRRYRLRRTLAWVLARRRAAGLSPHLLHCCHCVSSHQDARS